MSESGQFRVRIPSLQHFSTLVGAAAESIEKRLRAVPNFPVSYAQLREQWTIDLINLNVPASRIFAACEKLKGDLNKTSNLGALEALLRFIRDYNPEKLMMVDKRYFAIGRGLRVPVNPLGVVHLRGKPHLFWLSLWKRDSFNPLTRAVFGTILEKSIFAARDFRSLPLAFVDLSALDDDGPRQVRIYGREGFPKLADADLQKETDKFVAAYLRATRPEAEMSGTSAVEELPLFLDRPPA